jgi:hypothetical protein
VFPWIVVAVIVLVVASIIAWELARRWRKRGGGRHQDW